MKIDQLEVRRHSDRGTMGLAAAGRVSAIIREAVAGRGEARVIFACAPSQNDFLGALVSGADGVEPVDWSKVVAFHMDEYVGLGAADARSFRYYLQTHLLTRVPPVRAFHAIDAAAQSAAAECERYAALLREAPIDLVCLGIGENGHLAFNDPPVADFDDPHLMKKVELDLACRQQQVHDGCFPALDEVPRSALTLTIPALLAANHVSCVVPGERKAKAVRDALLGPISAACPASALRTHPRAQLHLDAEAAGLLAFAS